MKIPQKFENTLHASGWIPERRCDVDLCMHEISELGFQANDAAQNFLREFYALKIDVPINDGDGVSGFVHFAPEMVLRFFTSTEVARLENLMPGSACPIGTTGGHTVFIFMDKLGHSFLLDMEWTLVATLAQSPEEMLRVLCDGRNGRVDSIILDERLEKQEVIKSGDEQRHWNVDAFPNMRHFLPPVSLSPCRRPPTWRPMVRAAEACLSKTGTRTFELMIMCGGFAQSPSKINYFVAHCENSLYVRQKAQFKIAEPPPGIIAEFRMGEVLPFTY